MPRLFFSLHQGSQIEPDEEGTDFPDLDSAIVEAKALLPSIARELQWAEVCDLAVAVRDEAGKVVFTASLRLTAMQPVERRGWPP